MGKKNGIGITNSDTHGGVKAQIDTLHLFFKRIGHIPAF